ncbi:helix-turn-helix domain-containing protein [Deinococcus cellulosilyticus]|uniref:Transcriptional regulator n=1 Tax=Deinococcus cellulosilyticus (strain DSM 18568 / NBRC 106333 / KACC 11606 / 5516J-15) TaxID=1223518 RepID=A0A511MVL1_DEIC1|nr:XRE family transcriptional regulator [Deinococcus cellulosilyticus]GEM44615.1 transcriptional regulator [Deinococcus cellulosilyticus NBRC 106333 = KACC 11606]
MSDRTPDDLDVVKLGARIRSERTRRGITLDTLAERAGISRSMLSDVERGQKVPTIVMLGRIAAGLDTTVARFLEEEREDRVFLLKKDHQALYHSPGVTSRILSPLLPRNELTLIQVTLEPGYRGLPLTPHARGSREYMVMLKGSMVTVLNGTDHTLHEGDSLYYEADQEHIYANPFDEPCDFLLVMDIKPASAD